MRPITAAIAVVILVFLGRAALADDLSCHRSPDRVEAVTCDPRSDGGRIDAAMRDAFGMSLAGLQPGRASMAAEAQDRWLGDRRAYCGTATDVGDCVVGMTRDRTEALSSLGTWFHDKPELLGRTFPLRGVTLRFAPVKSSGEGVQAVASTAMGVVAWRAPLDGAYGWVRLVAARMFPDKDAVLVASYAGGDLMCATVSVLWAEANGGVGSADLGRSCLQGDGPARLAADGVGFSMTRPATPSVPGSVTAWDAGSGKVTIVSGTEGVAFHPVSWTTMAAVDHGREPLDDAEFHRAVVGVTGTDAPRFMGALWHAAGVGGYDPLGMLSIKRVRGDVVVTSCGPIRGETRDFCGPDYAIAMFDALTDAQRGAFRFAVTRVGRSGRSAVVRDRAFHPALVFWKASDIARLGPWWAAMAAYESDD